MPSSQRLASPISSGGTTHGSNLRLDSTKWSTRSSNGGFSVTLFWPSSGGKTFNRRTRRTRRRRKPKSRASTGGVHVTAAKAMPTAETLDLPTAPFTAHLLSDNRACESTLQTPSSDTQGLWLPVKVTPDVSSSLVLSEPTSEASQVTGSQEMSELESTESESLAAATPLCASLDHLKSAEPLSQV